MLGCGGIPCLDGSFITILLARLWCRRYRGLMARNNDISQITGFSLLFGAFVGVYSAIKIYLDSIKRRRVINPMISGGIVGSLLGFKNGTPGLEFSDVIRPKICSLGTACWDGYCRNIGCCRNSGRGFDRSLICNSTQEGRSSGDRKNCMRNAGTVLTR